MPDREKVKKGVWQCWLPSTEEEYATQCHDCPYYEPGITLDECMTALRTDVLALLKEQEAVVRCKDCKHRPKEPNLETYESGFDIEFPEGSKCPCRCCGDEWYSWYPEDEWFCADGERKSDINADDDMD